MAQGNRNTKMKLLCLMQIFQEETDEAHGITMPELIEALDRRGITAERKSLYSDIVCLKEFGMDIIGEQEDRTYSYRLASRPFELAELKLLVDAVQSSKFITDRKSRTLIRKIEALASKYEAKQLHRQVFVAGRVKTENETIYYNVDALHRAISEDRKIRFHYFRWNLRKEKELRHDGQLYEVSPWALTWDDESYYLVAYDGREEKIKHFRVDKMLNIRPAKERREGRAEFRDFDLAQYTRKTFGMFGGQEVPVTLRCENELANVIVDRFGRDVMLVPDGSGHFTTTVRVSVSRQFFGWVISLGPGAVLTGPDAVVEQMRAEAERLVTQYVEPLP